MYVANYSVGLAEECDKDVEEYCSRSQVKSMAGVWSTGSVGLCISSAVADGRFVALGCKNLLIAAAPQVCNYISWLRLLSPDHSDLQSMNGSSICLQTTT